MAHHKSAKKRIKQNEKRRMLNKSKLSRVRTTIKNLRKAIAKKDKANAQTMLVNVQAGLDKLAKTETIKKNSASRTTSKLASQIAKL
ncbi:MAG: 30S ribosomal protein S20 [Bacteriovoracia bacterium]